MADDRSGAGHAMAAAPAPAPGAISAGAATAGTGPDAGQSAEAAEYRARVRSDHRAIAQLADELLPSLIAKLAATGLGEIEIREGSWKARLRQPAGVDGTKRAAGRGVAAPGHAVHGHAAGHGPADGPRRPCDDEEEAVGEEPNRAVATSPAVGIYHPRRDLVVGTRVRAGDRIGTVDVLGVRQDVLAPLDGIIGASLAESGEAVEYGQELIRIELAEHATERGPERAAEPRAERAERGEEREAGRGGPDGSAGLAGSGPNGPGPAGPGPGDA